MLDIHPGLRLSRELKAARAAILTAWYGGASPRSPHGRRVYRYGRVRYLSENFAPLHVPLCCEEGQVALRAILTAWRTTYAGLAAWDQEHGGGIRRTLVAAGLVLKAGDNDARERADELVRTAMLATSPSRVANLDGFVARLAAQPAPAPWAWELATGR